MTHSFDAHDDPDVDSIWLWFEFQLALIREEQGRVLQMFQSGSTMAQAHPHRSRFTSLTRAEVEEFFNAQRGQLELLTMFELLATTAAILRIDFKNRVTARKKDELSRHFRELYGEHVDKVRLDEDILAAMKEQGVPANVVADFRGALKLRHWLAHGKHWHPKLGRGYTPSRVFDIVKALINSIPPW